MAVDESRQQGCIAKINDYCVGWSRGANGCDLFAIDNNDGVLDESSRSWVEQTGGSNPVSTKPDSKPPAERWLERERPGIG